MTVNKLKLNDEKTEFLIMTSKFHQHKIHDPQIKVDTASIPASESARNLRIIFNNNLCMENQIWQMCQSVHFHIRNIQYKENFIKWNCSYYYTCSYHFTYRQWQFSPNRCHWSFTSQTSTCSKCHLLYPYKDTKSLTTLLQF